MSIYDRQFTQTKTTTAKQEYTIFWDEDTLNDIIKEWDIIDFRIVKEGEMYIRTYRDGTGCPDLQVAKFESTYFDDRIRLIVKKKPPQPKPYNGKFDFRYSWVDIYGKSRTFSMVESTANALGYEIVDFRPGKTDETILCTDCSTYEMEYGDSDKPYFIVKKVGE